MPHFRRVVVPNYPHHVTQRGVRRQTVFFEEADYQTYIELASTLLETADLSIWAYCLMPNHIHAVVVPQKKDSLAKFFAPLHRRYARKINYKNGWTGHLWQQRYYSVPMHPGHTMTAMRYVELNPVRSGICRLPQLWRWSSTKGNLGLSPDPLVERAATKHIVRDWRTYLNTPEDEDFLKLIRQQTGTGRPDGDEKFIKKLEKLSGRRIRKKRAGRPKK